MLWKNILLALSITFSLQAQVLYSKTDPEYQLLNNLALQSGADKGSNYHDYTRIYSSYFNELREKPIKFLEIGIYKGNSVKMWEGYFPHAELHFIDITSKYLEYASTRSEYHFMDQENIPALTSFAQSLDGKFDVIIDDGGHTMKQQISSFVALFPFVKSGGMYIIEDLHTSYWREYGGNGSPHRPLAGKGTTIQFLKDRIDSLNSVGATSQKASFDLASPDLLNRLGVWEKEVLSMHFYDSVCIIFKR